MFLVKGDNVKFPLYTSELNKINLLERWIVIHSILYYKKNVNVVPDEVYDRNMAMLDFMSKNFSRFFKESRFYKTFENFDPSTGYDIPDRCKALQPKLYEKMCEESELLIYYAKEVWKIL